MTAFINGDSLVQTAKLLRANERGSELGEMINFLPPRTVDGEGREGDMLNLIFIAEKEDLESAFERAGWVQTEKSKPAIFWHLLRQRKHYVQGFTHGHAFMCSGGHKLTLLLCPTRLP